MLIHFVLIWNFNKPWTSTAMIVDPWGRATLRWHFCPCWAKPCCADCSSIVPKVEADYLGSRSKGSPAWAALMSCEMDMSDFISYHGNGIYHDKIFSLNFRKNVDTKLTHLLICLIFFCTILRLLWGISHVLLLSVCCYSRPHVANVKQGPNDVKSCRGCGPNSDHGEVPWWKS